MPTFRPFNGIAQVNSAQGKLYGKWESDIGKEIYTDWDTQHLSGRTSCARDWNTSQLSGPFICIFIIFLLGLLSLQLINLRLRMCFSLGKKQNLYLIYFAFEATAPKIVKGSMHMNRRAIFALKCKSFNKVVIYSDWWRLNIRVRFFKKIHDDSNLGFS